MLHETKGRKEGKCEDGCGYGGAVSGKDGNAERAGCRDEGPKATFSLFVEEQMEAYTATGYFLCYWKGIYVVVFVEEAVRVSVAENL